VFPDRLKQQLLDAEFGKVAELWKILEEQAGDPAKVWLCKNDRYYLLVRALKRVDAIHPWLYQRCREVEREPDGFLDVWAREHYKSTIITFAGIIQEILKNPDITVGIFSHTKPIAKAFLRQIQKEFEGNDELKALFPSVLYSNPSRESPSWSLDNGIVVRRGSNPKEATLEAHGLVDGQPTSKHFALLVYDDVVTLESVATPEQIQKTTAAWEMSDNLGTAGGRKWTVGTRYSYADTYETMMERQVVKVRKYPATDNGKIDGAPVLFTPDVWEEKVKTQGEATIACQMLQDPLSGQQRMFNVEDLRYYEVRPETMNIYVLVDPARSKKKNSAKTGIIVIGLDYSMNKYILDGFNHQMDLRERWERTAMLFHKWKQAPGVRNVYVGYEAFGAQADLDYFEEQMRKSDEGGTFPIVELAWPRDGEGGKTDRVQRLSPDMKAGKIFIPYPTDVSKLTTLQRRFSNSGQDYRISKPIRRKTKTGEIYDVISDFKMQVHFFPHGGRVDLIDAAARIYDMEPKAPSYREPDYLEPEFT
jgi:hypothetical protein